MTATDEMATTELRRLLDERGVEWADRLGPFPVTAYEGNGVTWVAKEYTAGMFSIETRPVTPAQAIAATLGSVECEVRDFKRVWQSTNVWTFSLSCGHDVQRLSVEPPGFCEECGAKVVER